MIPSLSPDFAGIVTNCEFCRKMSPLHRNLYPLKWYIDKFLQKDCQTILLIWEDLSSYAFTT